MKPTIMLQTGEYLDFENPSASNFTIADIARALSRIPRFTGHTRTFYSVAQHSLFVAANCPPHLRMQGLMHDAHEAFVGDMPTPLKILCPDYRVVEDRVAAAVRLRFGMPEFLDPAVKVVDLQALAFEKRGLMPDDDSHWECIKGVAVPAGSCTPLSSEDAETLFLHWFNHLTSIAPPIVRAVRTNVGNWSPPR